MCFDLTLKDERKYRNGTLRPKKATEDIIVYKEVSHDGYGLYYNLKDEKGQTMTWVEGYQYTELGRTDFRNGSYVTIHGGMLHSAKKPGIGKKKFIIPKGTNYYENDNEYVSKSLIYPKQIKSK